MTQQQQFGLVVKARDQKDQWFKPHYHRIANVGLRNGVPL